MQTLITALILLFAAAYLAWRWMPKSLRASLGGWISRKAPALSPYFSAPAGGCSSGCSSCGSSNADNTACSSDSMPKTNSKGRPVILLKQEQ
ncbi:hypothetical protein [Undibacterium terreum]|uniref:hypothetical protein n=1 Tax=Undibacterium terreum TaxID=1224302 RepID=UPI0016692D2B|nr:hypothetical protein [Undibacterium terreum]